jgi:hypothetical protein
MLIMGSINMSLEENKAVVRARALKRKTNYLAK